MIQEIPPYRLPSWASLGSGTWSRTKDIVTIVTPLLVAGSIVLACSATSAPTAGSTPPLLPVTPGGSACR